MGESTGRDSDGQEHFVWIQERSQSCGPACVYMIERNQRRANTVGGEERIRFITSLLPQGYTETGGTAGYTALALALNRIGFTAQATFTNDVSTYLGAADFPVIARIGWPSGGGHFVVCARLTRRDEVVCLDPWFGMTQQAYGGLPAYSATASERDRMSVSVGGTFSGHMVELLATPRL
jgi:hypothetical protein